MSGRFVLFVLQELARRARYAKPAELGPLRGRVRVARCLRGLIAVGGALCVVTGVRFLCGEAAAAGTASVWIGAAVVGIGVVFGLLAWRVGRPDYDVSWNESGLRGPETARFRLTLMVAIAPWDAIVRIDQHTSGTRWAETRDGHRVYWGDLYAGTAYLDGALRTHRPDLLLPWADEETAYVIAAYGWRFRRVVTLIDPATWRRLYAGGPTAWMAVYQERHRVSDVEARAALFTGAATVPVLDAFEAVTKERPGSWKELMFLDAGRYGAPCPACRRPFRTPLARWCASCGFCLPEGEVAGPLMG